MSVLNLIKKVKVQTLSFEKHPCRELEQEQMIHYLNGLALITNEDEKICDKEQEYLSILINSFGLSEDMLETFIDFAQNPDEKLILDMMQSFMSKDIKYNFMIDAMMIASIDGNVHENEKALINEYFEMFKITKDEEKDLRDIYKMFYKQDGNALFRYFGKQHIDDVFIIKKELFQYLIDYYKIDFKYELKKDEKKILQFEFFKPTFESGGLADGATEIMTKPVSNAQFCIYLNSAFLSKSIKFNGDGKIVNSETKDILMDLEMSNIKFIDNMFIINSIEDEDKKITGVTYVMAEEFSKWVSKYKNESYVPSSYLDSYSDIDSFTIKPLHEIVYSIYNNYYTKIIELYGFYGLHFNASQYSSKIDETFCDKEYSFRMMKLPEETKE